jgi:hypothetical protein
VRASTSVDTRLDRARRRHRRSGDGRQRADDTYALPPCPRPAPRCWPSCCSRAQGRQHLQSARTTGQLQQGTRARLPTRARPPPRPRAPPSATAGRRSRR